MKKLILICLAYFLFSPFTFSQVTQDDVFAVQTETINICRFWTSVRSADGRSVYACSGYPSSMQIPSTYEINQNFLRLENKIINLEKRIEELESKL